MNKPHAPTALVNTTHCQNGVSTGYRAHLQTEAACSFQLFQHFSKHFGALVAPARCLTVCWRLVSDQQ